MLPISQSPVASCPLPGARCSPTSWLAVLIDGRLYSALLCSSRLISPIVAVCAKLIRTAKEYFVVRASCASLHARQALPAGKALRARCPQSSLSICRRLKRTTRKTHHTVAEEAAPGRTGRAALSTLANCSSVPLENFYIKRRSEK